MNHKLLALTSCIAGKGCEMNELSNSIEIRLFKGVIILVTNKLP